MKKVVAGLLFILSVSIYCQAPFGNYISVGPNGYLVNADTALAPGASKIPGGGFPVTVECFFKMSSYSQTHSSLFSFGPGVFLGVSSNIVSYNYLSPSSSWVNAGFGLGAYNLLQWNHLVVEIYNSGGYWMSVGLNGNCIHRIEINSYYENLYQDGSFVRFFIGHNFHPFLPYNQGFYGFIDELRYSSVQRYNLMFPGTNVYTVPTSEFTTDANTRALLHFNEVPGATVAHDTTGFNRDFLIRGDAFISGPLGIYTNNGFVDNDTLCFGEQIYAQGGNQVTWNPSFGLSGNVWNPTITADDTTITYIATIVDLNTGVTGSDTITLFIAPKPDLGPDSSVCMGTSILLDVDMQLLPAIWSQGSTGPSISINTSGLYFVETYGWGCMQTDTMNFTIYPVPGLNVGNDTNICVNDTFLLNIGSGWSNILWSNGSTDTITTVLLPGDYFVEVTDINSCNYFDTISIAGDFMLNIDLGNDTSLCYNDSLFYNLGNTYSSITWWDGSHDTMHVINALSGTYFVEVIDPFTCQHFDTIQVIGYPMMNIDLGNDTSICYGDTVFLNVGNVWLDITWWDASNDTNNIATTSGTYFVELHDSNSCYYTDTLLVANNPSVISGFVYSSDSIPLVNTPVYFVQADTSNYILAIDSVYTDAFGFFSINSQLLDFSILIKPDSSAYPNEMPTYYDSSVTIQNSNFFNLNACDSVSVDIYSIYGINPGGPCFVGGTIVYGGRSNGDPVPGIKVIFVDAADNILGYTYANDEGYFYMNNLPAGDVRFWVDWPDIDNTIAPVLTLSSSSNFINVYFELYPDQLILLMASLDTDPVQEEDLDIAIYPNPVTENLFIKLPPEELGYLSMVNQLGVTILTQNLCNLSTINLENFSAGVYFLTIRMGDKQIIKRIVKI